ncbi:polysaccharide biosynthesis protein CapD [Agaricicola taiwanensis]|uniref:Polysaccharide biosynthesis protein CapD n=2 Tax=Agaricicola taiwanensis TaxID=591372 RepID=A0A8J2VQ17_9RHOB|nr:polysaccharide biosynthesis protein CapD [Agaricicola taiwanensis]
MAAIAFFLAMLFRYGTDNLPPLSDLTIPTATFAMVAAVVFRIFGLGRGIWRFASLTDLRAIVVATTTTVFVFLVAMFLINRLTFIPRSVPAITWFVLIVLLAGPRLAYRVVRDGGLSSLTGLVSGKAREKQVRLLIIGTALEADRVMRRFGLEGGERYQVVGIVDSKGKTKGRSVRGVPLLGSVAQLDGVLKDLAQRGLKPNAFVITAPRESREQLQAVAAIAAPRGIAITRVAETPQLLGGPPSLEAITLDDLLGRAPVKLDLARMRELVEGRTVMVTGAGGSIGSEITRQVAAYAPRRLLLVDNGEFNLYRIDREVAELLPSLDRAAIIADVRDRETIFRLIGLERPDIIFHAAALKHVPLVEANVPEGVLTNVVGTRNVADAAVAAGAQAMVMISTDKAIRPTSVMGATKRVAEIHCQALDVDPGQTTRFITVRFGNVLGSTGSVVPLFEHQIRAGGPVTVTHPEMRRYFMTIREATELVLQAAAHGLATETDRGRIFVLDMGEPVKIVDLARTMIALAGRRPDIDIAIEFTGLRPGEKLFEELFDRDEATEATATEGVFVASPRLTDRAAISRAIDRIEQAARAGDGPVIRALLQDVVPEMLVPDVQTQPLPSQRLPEAEASHRLH